MISLYLPTRSEWPCVYLSLISIAGGKGAHRVAINGAQVEIEPAIFFRLLFHFGKQPVRVNADADVTHHRTNHFQVVGA